MNTVTQEDVNKLLKKADIYNNLMLYTAFGGLLLVFIGIIMTYILPDVGMWLICGGLITMIFGLVFYKLANNSLDKAFEAVSILLDEVHTTLLDATIAMNKALDKEKQKLIDSLPKN